MAISESLAGEPVPVRIARLSDADGIARLTVQLGYEVDAQTVAERLSRILARQDQRFMVAELEDGLVGWVHAIVWEFVETGAFVGIGGLVVDRSLRRKGIGRTLVVKVEEWAVAQGCSVVRLWSSVARTEAHLFYQQLGYSNIKSQYSFVKSVDTVGRSDFGGFIPRLDR
jgi:GNAT superfamily N-acetyltransferase